MARQDKQHFIINLTSIKLVTKQGVYSMGNNQDLKKLIGSGEVVKSASSKNVKSAEMIFMEALKAGKFSNITGKFASKDVRKNIDKATREKMSDDEFPVCAVRGVKCRGEYYVFPCKQGKTLTLSNRIGSILLAIYNGTLSIDKVQKTANKKAA